MRDLENLGQLLVLLPILALIADTVALVACIPAISSFPRFSEVEETVSRSFTKLPCSGDLENPGPLPVSQALEGTDD